MSALCDSLIQLFSRPKVGALSGLTAGAANKQTGQKEGQREGQERARWRWQRQRQRQQH